jgi:hypothetical protein
LQIITSENSEKYKKLKEDNKISKDYEEYSLELLTNNSIQKVQNVSGKTNIQISSPNKLAEVIDAFLLQ